MAEFLVAIDTDYYPEVVILEAKSASDAIGAARAARPGTWAAYAVPMERVEVAGDRVGASFRRAREGL